MIAEAAQGFEGSLQKALRLVDKVSSIGSNTCLKFQLIIADELATPTYPLYLTFKRNELSLNEWKRVATRAQTTKVPLIFDVFGFQSLKWARDMRCYGIKIHPTDVTNIPLIERVVEFGFKNVYVGVGGCTSQEIQNALLLLYGVENVTTLFGFQTYPTHLSQLGLERLAELRSFLVIGNGKPWRIGYADHSEGGLVDSILASAIACSFGATVFEKHFTFSAKIKAVDDETALDEADFKRYGQALRDFARVQTRLPTAEWRLSVDEQGYREAISRAPVAATRILPGEIITPLNVVMKRTSSEKSLLTFPEILGRSSKRLIEQNEEILPADIWPS
jgi:sialic acid synthase SpsE